jgi:hypothetical protein
MSLQRKGEMDKAQIEAILTMSEAALASGQKVDLVPIGFWKAVTSVKKQPDLVEVFGDRIGRIDREAFERWALLRLPAATGTSISIVATAGGLALIGWAYGLGGAAQGIALLVGTGMVLVATHGLAHWAVAEGMGMKVIYWFVGAIQRPQPGVKIDYATYLRTPPRRRAWMHASGAIVSKAVPLISLGAGWAMGAPGWAMGLLAVLAVGQVIADVLWSTRSSDWKRFKREMAFAKSG